MINSINCGLIWSLTNISPQFLQINIDRYPLSKKQPSTKFYALWKAIVVYRNAFSYVYAPIILFMRDKSNSFFVKPLTFVLSVNDNSKKSFFKILNSTQ